MTQEKIKIKGESAKADESLLMNSFPLLPFPFDLVYLGLK